VYLARSTLLLTACLGTASIARAEFYGDLFRGLQVLAIPSGGPVFRGPGGAAFNGQRSGRVRIVRLGPAQGYRLEFNRTFGPDSFGRPEVFDLGNFEVQLSGGTAFDATITRRGIPTFNFNANVNNLNYSIRGKTGAQDFTLNGTLRLVENIEINPLGFYTLNLNVSNLDSQLTLQGLAAEGDRDTDFDIGPIRVRGNIFFDVAVATLASFGVDTTDIEGIFPHSPIDRITEEIRKSLETRAMARGLQVVEQSVLPPDHEFVEPAFVETLSPRLSSLTVTGTSSRGSGVVPEPTPLALILASAVIVSRRLSRSR